MADSAGAVWVKDAGNDRLVKLAAGSDRETLQPLPDLGGRGDVMAVDTAGNVNGTNGGGVYPDGGCCIAVHVVKSAAGSNAPTVLPFMPVNDIGGMAVDTFGDVYVGDFDRNLVLKLAAGRTPRRCCHSRMCTASPTWQWTPPEVCMWLMPTTIGC